MTYKNISKWLLVILFVVGAATCVFGFINGWPDNDEWKEDHSIAATLPNTIAAMEEAGIETLTSEEIDAKVPEIEALRNSAQAANTRLLEIKAVIDAAKSKAAKTRLEAEYKEEIDNLINEANECNLAISSFNSAKELNGLKQQLAETEERIAKGNASVNTILYGAYSMIAIVFIVLVIAFVYNWTKNPMSLVKFVGVILGGVLIIFAAYQIAPNPTPEVVDSYGIEGLAAADIKMTDVLLYLTYLMVGASFVALVTSWIVGATRK